MSLHVRRLSYALGAEITGVDLREPLNDETFSEIRSAFLAYLVILFRGSSLTREQHIAFTERFGELQKTGDKMGSNAIRRKDVDAAYTEIVSKKTPNKNALEWHSDRSFTLVPPMASLLRAVDIPACGGDTLFANMYLAYETLSERMKMLLEGLHGVHPGAKDRFDDSTPERLAESKRRNPPVAQPIVRVNPDTGRKSLYIAQKVHQFAGMTAEESIPLIQFLLKHATRPQFVYRHTWQKDDLIMWDNRCTNHMAVGDYDKSKIRHMDRTQVKGTPTGQVYEGPLEVSHY